MIKLIVLAVRKSGMSFEDFDRHWRDTHGPLVRGTTEFSRHVRKYVQSHKTSSDVPFAADAAYDGVAELYFDSMESLNAAFSEPRYLEIIRPDELSFLDFDRCVSIVCEEVPVI